MKTNQTRSSAFTLIELLVVIAIIAILAAILFPVFAKAREKARQTTCGSNLKQIGLGFAQYEADYDEQFPSGIGHGASCVPSTGVGCTTFDGAGWAGEVYPYVKSTDVYDCPDDPTQPSTSYGPVCSYGFNGNLAINLLGPYNPPGPPPYVAIAKLTSPVMTVLLYEAAGVDANVANVATYTDRFTNPPNFTGIDAASQSGVDAKAGGGYYDSGSYYLGYGEPATGYLGNPAHVSVLGTPNKLGPDPTTGRHTNMSSH